MNQNWWVDLAARWWPGDRYLKPNAKVHAWLQTKHDVATRLQPKVIGEIGVRAGYSAFAMLSACPNAVYIGIDPDDHRRYRTAEPGAVDYAHKLLSVFSNVLISRNSSHDLRRLPAMDLLHVDGDHSYEGCTADLELARSSNVTWVLVDDYNNEVVRSAVDAFVSSHGVEAEYIYDGLPNSALLRLK